jgi:LPXTG-site transpeptidase (sortase) family protein
MDVPKDIHQVGWYKFGAYPGDEGTAVLAGHVDGKNREPGVFSKLSLLKVGDIVLVHTQAGSSLSFRVRSKRTYAYDERPKEVFSSESGSHLNLITCTGPWDKGIGKFSKRLVVFTELVR